MKDNRPAFTIAELMMAIAIMAVVGLSVATVSMTLADAYAAGQEASQNVQVARTVMARIQRRLKRAELIIAAGSGTIVYWADDENGDARINIAEMVAIVYDSADATIAVHSVVFDENMDPAVREALDYQVALGEAADVTSGVNMIETNPRHSQQVMAEDVTAFEVAAFPACPIAKMLKILLTIGDQGRQITIRSAASLRVGRTDEVGVSDGQYVLTGDIGPG